MAFVRFGGGRQNAALPQVQRDVIYESPTGVHVSNTPSTGGPTGLYFFCKDNDASGAPRSVLVKKTSGEKFSDNAGHRAREV